MKKRWILSLIMAGTLAFGMVGSIALAQGDAPARVGIVARVAEILGLDQTVVQDAFDQAREERRDTALPDRLAKLVEKGVLTQEQADEIVGLDEAGVKDALAQIRQERRDAQLQRRLDKLVEKGRLTQEQADDYLSWTEARPDGLPKALSRGHFRGHRGHWKR